MKRLMRNVLIILSVLVGCFFGVNVSQQALAANFSSSITITKPVLAAVEVETGERRNRADDKLATEFGKKIDLNNTNVRAFQRYPGMYPNLAKKIILNAPYQKVEDVLSIEGLSDRQKEVLQANLDKFTVTEPESVFTEGDDRVNNGIYR